MIWDVKTPMEITQIGKNLYIIKLVDRRVCERIYNKQPWTYRGALILLDRFKGDERPEDINLQTAPIWIQAHSLQLRAMTKTAREQLGRLLGEVLDVKSDYDGLAMGRCVRIRALVDVNKPLCRWTMVKTDGVESRIIFRYEKIIDLCFYCGHLNHLDKDCNNIPPSEKKVLWLMAKGVSPRPDNDVRNSSGIGMSECNEARQTSDPLA